MTWAQLFPYGRTLFYEGKDPEGFAKKVLERFGFDVKTSPGVYGNALDMDYKVLSEMRHDEKTTTWGKTIPGCDDTFISYAFHCPPHLLDELYGNEEFDLGS